MSDSLDIRPETADDREAVRRIHEAAFATPAEADLVEALRESGASVPELCLVAAEGAEVVGHICFSRARLGADGPEILALAPMAVEPGRQRRGIGSELVREALDRAEATEYPLVVVLGHPDYYPRFGFDPASAYGVACPYDGVPPEAWMAYTLPAYRPGTRGTVAYAEAFTLSAP